MSKKIAPLLLAFFSALATHNIHADDIQRVRLFFGLSTPDDVVSAHDWEQFLEREIATTFAGFNVVDSLGYYRGKPERAKVVTVILPQKEIAKARAVAKAYAKKFNQESVMIVVIPVADWQFIGGD
ncbi:DUF3574 domain-containing protein [Candidatus Spongiihabitans sp.]|uniref:DUF3574 domain-containing protein n=1 Tax=Candidatus Spongiihabitans sp. TaxID=3101308 RepID=UPI003C7EA4FD